MTKITYPIKSYRVDERTHERLKSLRNKEDLSWNQLLLKLLESYEKELKVQDNRTR